jgi:hypothetical protein
MTVEEYREIVKKYCEGGQYDSCVNSPCPFSTSSGCKEPHIVEALDKLRKKE